MVANARTEPVLQRTNEPTLSPLDVDSIVLDSMFNLRLASSEIDEKLRSGSAGYLNASAALTNAYSRQGKTQNYGRRAL